jgi:hypothetical protein
MVTKDDRTPTQKVTHRLAVIGTDRCLSGWGGAAGGLSYAGWACTPDTVDACERWVRSRGDMRRVRVVSLPYRPKRPCVHFHLYIWDGEGGQAS